MAAPLFPLKLAAAARHVRPALPARLLGWLGWAFVCVTNAEAQGASELRGRVVSDSGTPIRAATVTVSGIGYSVRTDSLGQFRLAGTPGSTLNLTVRAEGYRFDSATVVLTRGRPVVRDFALVPESTPLPEPNPSDRVLRGRVVDDSGEPLSYANIQVNFGRRFMADDSGRFQFPVPASGSATLLIRRIGFEPAEVKLQAMPDTALRVQMTPLALALKGVVVTGASAFRALDTYGFYQRMKDAEKGINHGYFITPEDIARRNPSWITQMADGAAPGVRVKFGFRPWFDVIQGSGGCKMTVYLDNMRIVGKLGPTDDYVNELAMPTHVAAMEIYPRAVAAPPQYQPLNGSCGVVLIWTK